MLGIPCQGINGGMDGSNVEPLIPTVQVIVTIGTIQENHLSVQREKWARMYRDDKISIRQISRQTGHARSAIGKHLKAHGVAIQSRGKPYLRKSQPAFGERQWQGRTIVHMGEAAIANEVTKLQDKKLSLRQIGKILSTLGLKGKEGGDISHPETIKRICDRARKRNQ